MKKKISIITLVMAMLLAVGGFTTSTSTAVSAKNKKVNVWGHIRLLHTAVVGHVLVSGEIELLQVEEQNKAEPFLLIGEKLN